MDVEGDFDCSSKKIVSLNGIRFGSVVGNFYCHNNQLTSLEGAPREVRGISIATGTSSPLWREHLGKWEGVSIAKGTQFQIKP